MSQAAAPVPVRVQQLSGKEIFAASLGPSGTVGQLQAEVERRLGVSALHRARLCLGTEQLPADTSMAQLEARRPGGGTVVLDAVVTRSPEKEEDFLREAEQLEELFLYAFDTRAVESLQKEAGRFLKKYTSALELLCGEKEDIADDGPLMRALTSITNLFPNLCRIPIGDDGSHSDPFVHFFWVSASLGWTCVHAGERHFKDASIFRGFFGHMFRAARGHKLEFDFTCDGMFTEPVIAAMKHAYFLPSIGLAWNGQFKDEDWLPPRRAEQKALQWMACEHPQAAVREAARGLQLSRLEEQQEHEDEEGDADADADAAAAPPPREGAAAEAPELQRRGARREAAEIGAAEDDADGALASCASDEQEVEEMAEAVAQSEAEAIQHHEKLMEEALMRSIVGLAAVAPAVDVVVLKYNHCKGWLRDALLGGAALQEERGALEAAGFEPTLPSGAKIFVPPGVYTVVAEYDFGEDLKCSHVVVAAELESKIHSAVDAAYKAATRNERGRNKIMDRKAVAVPEYKAGSDASVEPSEGTDKYRVVRTFVEIDVHNSMRSASSFQPPTL